MKSMEELAREHADLIASAASSREGRKLAASVDPAKVKQAAESGDAAALEEVLRHVLSTPEGRALAEQVKRAVQGP